MAGRTKCIRRFHIWLCVAHARFYYRMHSDLDKFLKMSQIIFSKPEVHAIFGRCKFDYTIRFKSRETEFGLFSNRRNSEIYLTVMLSRFRQHYQGYLKRSEWLFYWRKFSLLIKKSFALFAGERFQKQYQLFNFSRTFH